MSQRWWRKSRFKPAAGRPASRRFDRSIESDCCIVSAASNASAVGSVSFIGRLKNAEDKSCRKSKKKSVTQSSGSPPLCFAFMITSDCGSRMRLFLDATFNFLKVEGY